MWHVRKNLMQSVFREVQLVYCFELYQIMILLWRLFSHNSSSISTTPAQVPTSVEVQLYCGSNLLTVSSELWGCISSKLEIFFFFIILDLQVSVEIRGWVMIRCALELLKWHKVAIFIQSTMSLMPLSYHSVKTRPFKRGRKAMVFTYWASGVHFRSFYV